MDVSERANRLRNRRLVAGATLSQVGNWVATTATLVFLQAEGGAALVALYFLLRTGLPFFLSRLLVRLVPATKVGVAWAALQVALAVLAVGLTIGSGSAVTVVVLTSVGAILQASSSALVMSLVASSGHDRASAVTGLSTGSAVAMVVGPAVGGYLFAQGGLALVCTLDAASFVAAVLIVPWWTLAAQPHVDRSRASIQSMFGLPARWPVGVGLGALIATWVAFGVFGGVFNSVEMPMLTEVQKLTADEVGLAIGAFGFGGLIVFIASTVFRASSRSLLSTIVLVVGTVGWIVASGWAIHAAFLVAGLGFSLLNAALRTRFDQVFTRNALPAKDWWAWLFQLSLLTSLVVYLGATYYFARDGALAPLLLTLGVSGVVLVIVAIAATLRLRVAERMPAMEEC